MKKVLLWIVGILSLDEAHSIGLGSCWINREREMFETEDPKT